jgi:hypothetical protein
VHRLKVQERLRVSAADYQSRQAACDLKKPRGKELVRKIGQSRLYEAPLERIDNQLSMRT